MNARVTIPMCMMNSEHINLLMICPSICTLDALVYNFTPVYTFNSETHDFTSQCVGNMLLSNIE